MRVLALWLPAYSGATTFKLLTSRIASSPIPGCQGSGNPPFSSLPLRELSFLPRRGWKCWACMALWPTPPHLFRCHPPILAPATSYSSSPHTDQPNYCSSVSLFDLWTSQADGGLGLRHAPCQPCLGGASTILQSQRRESSTRVDS